jgi:hypothetical protein
MLRRSTADEHTNILIAPSWSIVSPQRIKLASFPVWDGPLS